MQKNTHRFIYVSFRALVRITALLLGAVLSVLGQDQDPIKVDTVLLNVPVFVSDKDGKPVKGLTKDDFELSVNGQKQKIDFFVDSNEPFTYAILIDTSGSTKGIRRKINGAARGFVDMLVEQDQGIVVRFDEKVQIVQKLTNEKSKIRSAIFGAFTVSGGDGLMNEALLKVLKGPFKEIKGRKAIILITDGGEVSPKDSVSVTEELSSGDVVVYPIIYQSTSIHILISAYGDSKGGEEVKKMRSISPNDLIKYPPFDYLDKLAKVSGGRLLFPDDNSFESAFMNIADELRKQYVVGFYVDADSDPDTRNISIKVNRPDAIVRTKQSIRIGTH